MKISVFKTFAMALFEMEDALVFLSVKQVFQTLLCFKF